MSYGMCKVCGKETVFPAISAAGKFVLFCDSCRSEQDNNNKELDLK